MANAARLTSRVPSTTSPWSLIRRRSDTLMWPKCMANGLTQKWSSFSGSRAVMWPATPSSKPKRENRRNAPARRCLRWRRSSSTEVKVGGIGTAIGREATWAMLLTPSGDRRGAVYAGLSGPHPMGRRPELRRQHRPDPAHPFAEQGASVAGIDDLLDAEAFGGAEGGAHRLEAGGDLRVVRIGVIGPLQLGAIGGLQPTLDRDRAPVGRR